MISTENICKFNLNQTSDLLCTNFIFESTDCQHQPRIADINILHIVIAGSGVFKCMADTYNLQTGDMFVVCSGETYYIECGDSFEYCYISFRGRRSAEYIERIHINGQNRVFKGNESIVPFWKESLKLATDNNIDMISEAVLLYSLAKLSPAVKATNDAVKKVMQYTNENYTDAELSLSSVSKHAGYNEKYISTLFKRQCGISYTQYLRDLKLKHAVFLMEQGVASVKNVAFLSGFKDPLYFSKVFTQTMGMPPKVYIAQIQTRT